MLKYSEYFGFKKEPFIDEISTKDLLQLPGTISVKQRMDYTINIGGIMVVSGDVGSGKSTSLRWALSHYHRSELLSVYAVANTGSINELYKQICWGIDLNISTGSRSKLVKEIQDTLAEIHRTKKQKILVVIDEASLLRIDVFAELHALTQFEYDSKKVFSIVLAGQTILLDKLGYKSSLPLASRVITRVHLSALNLDQMKDYLHHHLKLTGIKKNLFSEEATVAIHNGSAGLLRKANSLARGSLIACMIEEKDTVTAEHVRIASTELL